MGGMGGMGGGMGSAGVISEQPPLQRDVFVFIADIADNAGLDISPEQINQALRRRRLQFERLQASATWSRLGLGGN